jgi:hypothetical protein
VNFDIDSGKATAPAFAAWRREGEWRWRRH